MKDKSSKPAVDVESAKRKHESREPHLLAAIIIAVSTAALLVICLLAAGAYMHRLAGQRPMHAMESLGLVAAPDQKPLTRFPKPNLELDDGHADSTALVARQETKLNSYGWVDRSNGIVHIPIERAMDLIVARGLPVQNSRTNEIESLSWKGQSP
jgi:hypothetical protein